MIDYTKLRTVSEAKGFDQGLRDYMISVYNYMAMALLVTALAGFVTVSFEPLKNIMFNFAPNGDVVGNSGLGFLVIIAPIFLAFYFFSNVATLDVEKSKTLLWVYAVLTGMSLSILSFVYTDESIVRTFLICSATFAGMGMYGYTTKKDLTAMGSFLVMGLMGLMITSLVNMFVGSESIYWATSLIGVGIFMGLIAYDTQKLKHIYFASGGGEMGRRMAVYGAFSLYLDFINLFLYLIRFLGVRRND